MTEIKAKKENISKAYEYQKHCAKINQQNETKGERMNISKTQINMYRRCPYQYYCRYIMDIKKPPTSSLWLGSGFDKALNVNYEAKIRSGKDEPTSVVKDAFCQYLDDEKGNTIFDKDEKPDKMKDAGVKTVDKFHREVCPKVKPKEVQIKDTIKFKNVDYGFMVIVDLLEHDDVIVDNKFTKRRWSDGKELQELDPVAYGLWHRHKYGKPEKEFRFDIAVNTLTPSHQQRVRKVSDEEVTGFLQYVGTVHDSIMHDTERGIFLPNPTSFMCSKKYCGYHEICSREWKHKIKE